MTIDASTLARALDAAACESSTLSRFLDDLDGWNGSDCDTGSNAALTLAAMARTAARVKGSASFAEGLEAVIAEGLSSASGHIGVLVTALLASWAHELGAAEPSPVAVRRMLRAALTGPMLEVSPSPAIAACMATAGEAVADLGDTLTGTPYLVSWYSMSIQEGLVGATDDRTGRIDPGASVFAILFACLDAAVGGDSSVLESLARMLSELADAQGRAPSPAPPAPERAFAVDVLWRATREDAKAHVAALTAMGARVSLVGVVDPFGVGTWRLHADTSAPLAVRPRGGALLRFQVADARPDEELGVDELDDEILTHRGVRLLERRPLRRVERARVLACTRAPGLVEDLARTGALVLLNPSGEDGAGIAALARASSTRATLFVPCDEASAALGGAVSEALSRQGDEEAAGTRVMVAGSRDDLSAFQVAHECAGSFVPQPGGAAVRDQMSQILADSARSALSAVRTQRIDGDTAGIAAAVSALMSLEPKAWRLLLCRSDGPDLVALVRQILVHEGGERSMPGGAYGARQAMLDEPVEGPDLEVIDGGQDSGTLLQAVG